MVYGIITTNHYTHLMHSFNLPTSTHIWCTLSTYQPVHTFDALFQPTDQYTHLMHSFNLPTSTHICCTLSTYQRVSTHISCTLSTYQPVHTADALLQPIRTQETHTRISQQNQRVGVPSEAPHMGDMPCCVIRLCQVLFWKLCFPKWLCCNWRPGQTGTCLQHNAARFWGNEALIVWLRRCQL